MFKSAKQRADFFATHPQASHHGSMMKPPMAMPHPAMGMAQPQMGPRPMGMGMPQGAPQAPSAPNFSALGNFLNQKQKGIY